MIGAGVEAEYAGTVGVLGVGVDTGYTGAEGVIGASVGAEYARAVGVTGATVGATVGEADPQLKPTLWIPMVQVLPLPSAGGWKVTPLAPPHWLLATTVPDLVHNVS